MKIIKIDEEKCIGCGLCAEACHEGAIQMVDGKAKLVREDHCDGLGDCLPACPTGAIELTERPACRTEANLQNSGSAEREPSGQCPAGTVGTEKSAQWPVQLKLLPVRAEYFDGADLLVAADCTAFAREDFHRRFLHGRALAIGCPKLDGTDYSEKLAEILKNNRIRSVTVLRMSVPCCGGLEHAARRAVSLSGKEIPVQVEILAPSGATL